MFASRVRDVYSFRDTPLKEARDITAEGLLRASNLFIRGSRLSRSGHEGYLGPTGIRQIPLFEPQASKAAFIDGAAIA
jgi:hypothetical protein